jgi:hypothetical protein
MTPIKPQKSATQTGPLPAAPAIGQFAFRDGVWYMTPALKTQTKPQG